MKHDPPIRLSAFYRTVQTLPRIHQVVVVHDHVADNEIYFSSSERFFMDPKSCPEWKTKFMPSQERVLKSKGLI